MLTCFLVSCVNPFSLLSPFSGYVWHSQAHCITDMCNGFTMYFSQFSYLHTVHIDILLAFETTLAHVQRDWQLLAVVYFLSCIQSGNKAARKGRKQYLMLCYCSHEILFKRWKVLLTAYFSRILSSVFISAHVYDSVC